MKDDIRKLVDKYTGSGMMRKPALHSVVDPEDRSYIRDLKRRGESNQRIAAILHVTDEALKQVLDTMNLK